MGFDGTPTERDNRELSTSTSKLLSRRSVLKGSGVGLASTLTGLSGETVAAVARTQKGPEGLRTIPAIREWSADDGSYTYGHGSRIVLDPSNANALEDDAETFANDLTALTGVHSAVIPRGSNPHSGDIFLTLDATDDDLGEQGYRMIVDDVLTIRAQTPLGVFYGTRTVLQLLGQSRTVSGKDGPPAQDEDEGKNSAVTIPGGVARDWPSYPRRGVLVANDDRRFPLDWWRKLIIEHSYLKMNEIVLILKKNGISDAKIPDLAAIAKQYHVNLVPQINRPGHSPELLEKHPEYALDLDAPYPIRNGVDITNPDAREFMKNEIKKYIDEFPSDYWHVGGDEYLSLPVNPPPWEDYPRFAEFAKEKTGDPNATGQDAYVWFINSINDLVKSYGKILRMWNDQIQSGGVLELDDDIDVDYWRRPPYSSSLSAQQFAKRGHEVLNANSRYTFYDQGIDSEIIYEDFDVTQFSGGTVTTKKNILGTRYQLWALRDDGNEEILKDMFTRLRSLSQAVWQDPGKNADYDEFRSLMNQIGHPPGYGVDIETQAPETIYTGTTAQVITSFTNDSGYAAHNVQMTLDVPEGWTVEPTSQTKFSTVERDQTVTTNWQVSVPRDYRITGDGNYTLKGTVTYKGKDDQGSDHSETSIQAAPHIEYDGLAFDIIGTDTRKIQSIISITNHLTSSDTIQIPLKIDGQIVQSKEVTVAGKSTQQVMFTYVPEETGLHQISIGDSDPKSIGLLDRYSAFAGPSVDATVDIVDGDVIINSNGLDIWLETDDYGAVYLDDAIGSTETVVTKIESQEVTGNYQKAGIMVRNDITKPGSSVGYICVEVTPGHGPLIQWDSDEDGYAEQTTYVNPGISTSYPIWLKLEKNGTKFTGYHSSEGSNWSKIDTVTIGSATDIQDVGMFVTSKNRNELCRVEFSEFSLGE